MKSIANQRALPSDGMTSLNRLLEANNREKAERVKDFPRQVAKQAPERLTAAPGTRPGASPTMSWCTCFTPEDSPGLPVSQVEHQTRLSFPSNICALHAARQLSHPPLSIGNDTTPPHPGDP